MPTPDRVIFHEPSDNQETLYLLHVTELPEIFAISAWVEHRLLIPWITFSLSFGIRDEGADAHQVAHVHRGQTVHPPPLHRKNILLCAT